MDTVCISPNCERPQYKDGYCKIHNNRLKKYGAVNCTVENCEEKYFTHGLCKNHSMKYYRHGDPKGGYGQPETVRFWRLVQKTDKCWNWIGSTTTKKKPYGRFRADSGKLVVAHRYSYELAYGKIPERYQVDHLCKNERCVNPKHLIASTASDHQRRHSYMNKTCKRGHPWTPENTILNKTRGWRACKTCARMTKKEKLAFDNI